MIDIDETLRDHGHLGPGNAFPHIRILSTHTIERPRSTSMVSVRINVRLYLDNQPRLHRHASQLALSYCINSSQSFNTFNIANDSPAQVRHLQCHSRPLGPCDQAIGPPRNPGKGDYQRSSRLVESGESEQGMP